MSKPKYPFEKRLEVVNHYFTTDDGYRIISARFGVPRTQVRTWVALYEKHGEKGLIPKPKGVSADPELRIKVVKAVIEQHMSLNQAAAHFMLAGSGSLQYGIEIPTVGLCGAFEHARQIAKLPVRPDVAHCRPRNGTTNQRIDYAR